MWCDVVSKFGPNFARQLENFRLPEKLIYLNQIYPGPEFSGSCTCFETRKRQEKLRRGNRLGISKIGSSKKNFFFSKNFGEFSKNIGDFENSGKKLKNFEKLKLKGSFFLKKKYVYSRRKKYEPGILISNFAR